MRRNSICGISIGLLLVSLAALARGDEAAPAIVMKAGVAKGVITPENWKQLTTVMGTKPTRKDHEIYARALVLNDGQTRLAIVTYDLNCLDVATPILRRRCRDELKISPAQLILMATHNHSAPIQIVPDNFEYGRKLADQIFGLISEAIKNEQGPARIELGQGLGYFVRAFGNAPADYDLNLLKVSVGEKPLAVLFNYPTHPLQSSNAQIDVGHPGYAMDEIEAAIPGVQAMYSDACGGNQFPDRGILLFGTHEQVKTLGKELAKSVLHILSGKLLDVTGKLESTLEILSLPLAAPMSLEEARKLAEKQKVPLEIGFVPYPHPDRGTNWIRALIRHHEEKIPFPTKTTDRVCTDDEYLVMKLEDGREFPSKFEEVIVAKIGPLCFVAMQGEVCAPIGMRIKDAFRRQMPLYVTAYMGEHNLYIPTRELVRLDAYQAQVIKTQYASPVGWAPEVEDEMVNGVMKLITKVTGKKPDLVVR